MKKKNGSKIALVLAGLFMLVGLFCMFASAFSEGDSDTSINVRGNVFTVSFGTLSENGSVGYNVVPVLVIGFCLVILGVLVGFAAFFLNKKGLKIASLIEGAFGLATAIIYLNALNLYTAANADIIAQGTTQVTGTTTLGAGSICVVVFAFIALAFSALTFYLETKKDED